MATADPYHRPDEAGPDSPEDLAANRAGQLTAGQKQRLWSRLLPTLIGQVFGALILVPFLACFLPVMLGGLWEESGEGWTPLIVVAVFSLVPLGLAAAAAVGLWRPALALWDAQAGRVETGDGRLVWKGRAYQGVLETRALGLLPGDERLPGAYRFYYLPRSGLVLSAERLFLGGLETDAAAELRRALQDVFDFQPEDLSENAAGRLSSRQSAGQWWAYARQGLLLGLFFIPFLLVFGTVFPYVFLIKNLLAGEAVGIENWIPALCAPGFLLFFLVLAGARLVKPLQDLWAGEVASVSGEVIERAIVTGSGKNRRTDYYYVVDGQRYSVSAAALQALVQGRPYRLYYLPRSKKVVSVEPL